MERGSLQLDIWRKLPSNVQEQEDDTIVDEDGRVTDSKEGLKAVLEIIK